MLRIFDGNGSMNRRELLQVGGLGLGGLSLSSLLGAKAHASGTNSKPNPLTGKSVIFLFQQGGPSQLETFDPKPNAPSGTRTAGGLISTTRPGVQSRPARERQANQGHKPRGVGRVSTKDGANTIQPHVNQRPDQAKSGKQPGGGDGGAAGRGGWEAVGEGFPGTPHRGPRPGPSVPLSNRERYGWRPREPWRHRCLR